MVNTKIEISTLSLPAGDLEIAVNRSCAPLEALCGFAARLNPKRGFLFVSKVLGRHIPVRPSVMRRTYRDLSAMVADDLPGPVLFVGMAETAICMGTGVFDEWVRRTGRHDALFVHTTRYAFDAAPAFAFREEHSHATGHNVCVPVDPRDADLMRSARTLVLVDDEASTGKTFGNFVRAAGSFCVDVERLVCVVLTDWSGGRAKTAAAVAAGVPADLVSLLEGEYRFERNPDAPTVKMPNLEGDGRSRSAVLRTNYGRFGIRKDPCTPAEIADNLALRTGERALVLGTGEFVWAPFRLAELLEARGVDAWCQATTRSPIMVGHAIANALTFRDNYGDGIQNYLYNAIGCGYDRVVLCLETPAHSADPELAAALSADIVCF
ncbi:MULTISPECIES: phosphoribosyltransferase domain-containing protein [Azospirillaceae]|uniref:phosphoribosyltransferase domain-containing protein n=1 Tax=Niveispirillum sp. BGYR6 TaxID=2971249 RepID=UPI000B6401FE|nr:phosphoribosyltransferase domain-containing protein [Niveispirillum sp. BGYR6]SNT21198.1 TRSP domain C terminus to PRTase_2 [Azospirillum sp. RU38E]SNT32863.1 TRSP domain C terminus to PRTase_2 [Azospirillum sp. RU37A]